MGEKERSVSFFYESPSYEESGRSIQTHSIENTTFNYKQKERKKTDSSKGIVGGLGIYLYRIQKKKPFVEQPPYKRRK